MTNESESSVQATSAEPSRLRNAADHLSQAREHLSTGVSEAVSSGKDAAREAKAELDDKFEKLLDQGKDMFYQAEDLIRSRPWTTFGAAFAAGYLVAKLTRRS